VSRQGPFQLKHFTDEELLSQIDAAAPEEEDPAEMMRRLEMHRISPPRHEDKEGTGSSIVVLAFIFLVA
jgi:hypothetical protein